MLRADCFPPLIGGWNDLEGVKVRVGCRSVNVVVMVRVGPSGRTRVTSVLVWNDLEQSTISNCTRPRADHDIRYRMVDDAETPYELNTNVLINSQSDVTCGGESQLRLASRPICSLTSDPGYIIYSACGSFWFPMFGMVVFYWKIYKTAVAATEAYKRGFVEQKTSGLSSSASENALCKLRVHRGGSSNSVLQRHSNGCLSELLPRPSADVIQATRRSVAGGARQTGSHATSFRRGAIVTAAPAVRPDVTSSPDVTSLRAADRRDVTSRPRDRRAHRPTGCDVNTGCDIIGPPRLDRM